MRRCHRDKLPFPMRPRDASCHLAPAGREVAPEIAGDTGGDAKAIGVRPHTLCLSRYMRPQGVPT